MICDNFKFHKKFEILTTYVLFRKRNIKIFIHIVEKWGEGLWSLKEWSYIRSKITYLTLPLDLEIIHSCQLSCHYSIKAVGSLFIDQKDLISLRMEVCILRVSGLRPLGLDMGPIMNTFNLRQSLTDWNLFSLSIRQINVLLFQKGPKSPRPKLVGPNSDPLRIFGN